MDTKIPVNEREVGRGAGIHVEDYADRVSAGLGDARERLEEFGERALHFVRERPATSLLIALAAGYVVGRMLRA
jgi:hypothetical protein